MIIFNNNNIESYTNQYYTGLEPFEHLLLSRNQKQTIVHTICVYNVVDFDSLREIIVQTAANSSNAL